MRKPTRTTCISVRPDVLDALTPAERAQFEAWCARTHRDVSELPAPGYRAPDPRTLFRA